MPAQLWQVVETEQEQGDGHGFDDELGQGKIGALNTTKNKDTV